MAMSEGEPHDNSEVSYLGNSASSGQEQVGGIHRRDLPGTWLIAKSISGRAEKKQEQWTVGQLMALILTAVAGSIDVHFTVGGSRINFGAILGLGFLGWAGYLAVELIRQNPEAVARTANQVAARVESIAWRYASGARPFGVETRGAEEVFHEEIRALRRELVSLPGFEYSGRQELTPGIEQLRVADRDTRIEHYRESRLNAVRDGYVDEIAKARRSSVRWSRVLIGTYIGGAIGTFLVIIDLLEVDALGIAAAVAAAITAWREAHEYEAQVSEASMMAADIDHLHQIMSGATFETEDSWSLFARQCEEVIERRGSGASGTLLDRANLLLESLRHPKLSWQEFHAMVVELADKVEQAKFAPHAILAINPGGGIVGGLLYFEMGRYLPYLPVSLRPLLDRPVRSGIEGLKDFLPEGARDRLRLLVVDASCKSGNALRQTLDLISEIHGEETVEIRTAVLVWRESETKRAGTEVTPDFFIEREFEEFPYGAV